MTREARIIRWRSVSASRKDFMASSSPRWKLPHKNLMSVRTSVAILNSRCHHCARFLSKSMAKRKTSTVICPRSNSLTPQMAWVSTQTVWSFIAPKRTFNVLNAASMLLTITTYGISMNLSKAWQPGIPKLTLKEPWLTEKALSSTTCECLLSTPKASLFLGAQTLPVWQRNWLHLSMSCHARPRRIWLI